MKNPLHTRLLRQVREDRGKYISLFLFLVLSISLVSGFLVADNSMIAGYHESFDRFRIEDGHFTTSQELDPAMINTLESNSETHISALFYKDVSFGKKQTIRVYKKRSKVNQTEILKGKPPAEDDEIAIDRVYAANNHHRIGDSITLDHHTYTITGFVALSDYSSLFQDNNDMIFDGQNFSVAIMTGDGYDRLDTLPSYTYAWTNDKKKTYAKNGKEIMQILAAHDMLTDFVREQDNQAIHFAGDDMGSDRMMMIVLLYVIIAIIGFIFAVSVKSTIEKESLVIGTLRATGYRRSELLRHYIILPVLFVILAAVAGNILGYTELKAYMMRTYYNSYSLTSYKTLWNMNAFLQTTIIPLILIVWIHIGILSSTLSLSPIRFMRHDLHKHRIKRAIALPNWKFLTRFRIRVILQNASAYITMLIGIGFANVLLVFGLSMLPMIDHYQDTVQTQAIASYQYILKAPFPTQTENAEKYAVTELENDREVIMVYGIQPDSKYVSAIDSIRISRAYAEKYRLKKGDTIRLHKEYTKKKYTMKVEGIYNSDVSVAVYMPIDRYRSRFNTADNYFNGYFSDHKIKDIDPSMIVSRITKKDLGKIADQMTDSVGGIMNAVAGFAVIMYVLIIYVLSKLTIERNADMISMIQILGFNKKEIRRIYSGATTIVVIVALFVTLPLSNMMFRVLFQIFMQEMNGWIQYHIAPWIYPFAFGVGLISYGVVYMISDRQIRKIPMSRILKNMN